MTSHRARVHQHHRRQRPKKLPIVDARALADKAMVKIRDACAANGCPISCPTGDDAIGCNGCCRGEIIALPGEAEAIAERMDDASWERVRALPDSTDERRRAVCPLLDPDTGACSVYDIRPCACRVYAVVSPVDWCYPERAGLRDVGTPSTCVDTINYLGWKVLGSPREPTTLLTLGEALTHILRRRRADAAQAERRKADRAYRKRKGRKPKR